MAQLAEKPTAAAPRIGKQGDPCVMVIFGAAGDLTARMLIPALYNLARADLLSKEFAVLGVARAQMTDEDFRKRLFDDVKKYCGDCIDNEAFWQSFSRRSRTALRRSTAITLPMRISSITWRPPRVTSVRLSKGLRPADSWIRTTATGAG